MSKDCILLTCEYPFITGEPFLENEIEYLSKSFDNIYLFSINASKKEKCTRNVPNNVKVFPLNCIFSKLRYPVYMFNGLFCREKQLKINETGLKKILLCLYSRGRSDIVLRKILKIINENNLSKENLVIYSYWFTDQAVTAWRLKQYFYKKGFTVKAISRAHRYDLYWESNSFEFLPYQEISLSNLDGVYSCSDDGNLYLKKLYPNYKNKIFTARLGTLDRGILNYDKTNVFLTCCSLKKIKRISLFAKAFAILIKHNYNAKWICIGDGEEFEYIQSIISENNIGDKVDLLGRMHNLDVQEYYKNNGISYFCNVSTTEGVPVSIMEAMSFGIPIIATDVGGSGELVSNDCGFLVSSDLDEIDLSNILIKAIETSKVEYLEKRRNARLIWEEKSSADNNYKLWCKELDFK